MAHVAAVGAVGDGFFVDGALVSENREVAVEAVRQGLLEIRKQELGEQYLLNGSEGQTDVIDVGDYLDVLGGVGYYQKGPDMGVRVCLEGVSPESDRMVEDLEAIRTRLFDEEIAEAPGRRLEAVAPHPVVSRRDTVLPDGGQDGRGIL